MNKSLNKCIAAIFTGVVIWNGGDLTFLCWFWDHDVDFHVEQLISICWIVNCMRAVAEPLEVHLICYCFSDIRAIYIQRRCPFIIFYLQIFVISCGIYNKCTQFNVHWSFLFQPSLFVLSSRESLCAVCGGGGMFCLILLRECLVADFGDSSLDPPKESAGSYISLSLPPETPDAPSSS